MTDVLSGAWCHTPTSAGAKTIVCQTCTEMLEVISSTASATGVEGSASIEVMLRELRVQKCFPGQYEGESSGGGSVFRKETSNTSDERSLLSEPFHFTKGKALPARGKASGGRAASSSASTVDTNKAKGPISTSKNGYRRWSDEETSVLRTAVGVHGDDAEAIKSDPRFAEVLQYRNAEAIWNKILREALLPSMNNSTDNSVVGRNERPDRDDEGENEEEDAEFEEEVQVRKQKKEGKDVDINREAAANEEPEDGGGNPKDSGAIEETAQPIGQESAAMDVEKEEVAVQSEDTVALDVVAPDDAPHDIMETEPSTATSAFDNNNVDGESKAHSESILNTSVDGDSAEKQTVVTEPAAKEEGKEEKKEEEEEDKISRASTPAPQRAARSRSRGAAPSPADSLFEDTSAAAPVVPAATSRNSARLSATPTPDTSGKPEKTKVGRGKHARPVKVADSASKPTNKPTEDANTAAAAASAAIADESAEGIEEEEVAAEAPRMVATRTSRRAVEEQKEQSLLSTRSGKKLFLSGNDLLPSFH